jgi:hypothetical protein
MHGREDSGSAALPLLHHMYTVIQAAVRNSFIVFKPAQWSCLSATSRPRYQDTIQCGILFFSTCDSSQRAPSLHPSISPLEPSSPHSPPSPLPIFPRHLLTQQTTYPATAVPTDLLPRFYPSTLLPFHAEVQPAYSNKHAAQCLVE